MAGRPAAGRWTPASAARAAGALFIVASVLTLLQSWVFDLAGDGVRVPALRASAVGAMVLGVAVWVLPWDRWHPRATMAIAVVGAGYIAGTEQLNHYAASEIAASTYPTLFLVVLVWVGLTQPRWWAAGFAPFVAAGFAWSVATTPDSAIPGAAALVSVPLAALLGELFAWMLDRDRSRTAALEAILQVPSRLAEIPQHPPGARSGSDASAGGGRERAGDLIAEVATRAFDVAAAHVAVGDPSEGVRLVGRATTWDRAGPSDSAVLDVLERALTGQEVVHCGDDVVGLALRGSGQTVGAVAIGPVRSFGRADRATSAVFSTLVGGAMAQRAVIDSLTQRAARDPLTGVGNRRQVDHLLDGLEPGDAVALVDLDHFKAVNDSHGHLFGDEVLRSLADHLVTSVRDGDLVARFGGEEFVVVFRAAADAVMDVATRVIDTWRLRGPATTCSMGVAVHQAGDPPRRTLAAADDALYQAKQSGRDRVVLAAATATAPAVTG